MESNDSFIGLIRGQEHRESQKSLVKGVGTKLKEKPEGGSATPLSKRI